MRRRLRHGSPPNVALQLTSGLQIARPAAALLFHPIAAELER
jgi:hypothetical protein